MEFGRGERVRHPPKPDWGIGEVLEDTAGARYVRVFFVDGGDRKLLLDAAVTPVRVSGADAAHPALDELGVQHSSERHRYRSVERLIDDFTKDYPGGFHGERYIDRERDYKIEAHEKALELLGSDALDALLRDGDVDEVIVRAKQVLGRTNLVFKNEVMKLNDGLRDDETNRTRFAAALTSLLHGEGTLEARFTGFASVLEELGAACWPLATYFGFLVEPERHLFLKPTVTRRAADVCGFELQYRPALNWQTYERTLAFGQHLFEALEVLRPRDMIDVQGFMWCVREA